MTKIEKVVLAYSGGLDTSVVLKWLIEAYGCEVVTMTADLGQEEDLDGVEEKALATGASKAYVLDLQEEFAGDFVFPMLRAGALYEGRYLMGTAIARPLIAKAMVQVARKEGAQAVAYGATGKGNDQVRFEVSTMALAPELTTIAPWRVWDFKSRTELVAFARRHGIPVGETKEKLFSIDRNLLHCSFEGGLLEDPAREPGDHTHLMVKPMGQAPDEHEDVSVDFEAGDPVAVNGERLGPVALVKRLNGIAGRHGVGRVDMVENRCVGMKSRGLYETPGGTVLSAARRDLEGICMDREVMHLRDTLAPAYAKAVYTGLWYSPEREALQAFMDKAQERLTGTVRLRLYKGCVHSIGRTSPNSLYREEVSTFEEGSCYDQADAAGFIRLTGLRLLGCKQCEA